MAGPSYTNAIAERIADVLNRADRPLKAREIAAELSRRGWRVERRDVNSILYSGEFGVRFEAVSGNR